MKMPVLPRVRRIALIVLSILASVPTTLQAQSDQVPPPKRPNIIFILTDDLDLALYNDVSALHHVLNERGTTFDNHYVGIPLCCPSRTTTLRGQFGHNTGVTRNSGPDGGYWKFYNAGLENSTIATWLQDSGYRTALIGKYLNGYPNASGDRRHIPVGWDHWVSPMGGDPYTQYNYTLNINGRRVPHGSADTDYLDDVLRDQAVKFIRQSVASDPSKPFFLYFAPYTPHSPSTPPPRYLGMRGKATAPRTAAFNESDTGDKPAWVRLLAPLEPETITRMDDIYRKRRAAMLGIRDLVTRIQRAVANAGIADNTYLIFTSDNGFHFGQHRLANGKSTAFEEDVHVPLVVIGPGVAAGAHVSALTTNADFAPTFAALAGATPPDFVDGRSIVPLMHGETPDTWRDAVLLESGPSTGILAQTLETLGSVLEPADLFDLQLAATINMEPPKYSGMRTHRYTYVEYDYGDRELYDNLTDPAQLANVASSADPELLASLHGWLDRMRSASGQAMRDGEVDPSRVPVTEPDPPVDPPIDPPPVDPPPVDPPTP